MSTKDHEKLMELKHEPVPGYRTAFFVVLAIAGIYLLVTFL